MLAPLSTLANGYPTDHSFEANSSFDRPATYRRPLTNARSVTDCARGLRPVAVAVGAFGRATVVNSIVSNATRLMSPAPSMRTSAGWAVGPVPFITAMNEFFEVGWTARSVIVMPAPSVPSSAAILVSTASTSFVPATLPEAWAPSLRATIDAAARSAANNVPSGANVSGPMLVNEGPTAGVRPAESGADTEAMASKNTVTSLAKVRMCRVLREGELGTLDYGM